MTDINKNEELIDDLMDDIEHAETINEDTRATNNSEGFASTIESTELADCLIQIEQVLKNPTSYVSMSNFEALVEHNLVINSNKLLENLEKDQLNCFNFIKQNYSKRFPELETLVTDKMDYSKAVKIIGNNKDLTKLDLISFLSAATVMVINISIQSTKGTELSASELKKVEEAADVMFEIETKKLKIINFVKSQVNLLVPNLSRIVGTECAAQLLTATGGLNTLIKMPACNVLLVGNQKKDFLGFSRASATQHAGYIYYCNFVEDYPLDIRRQVARIVASKSVLAIRADYARASLDGSLGKRLKEEIVKRLEKIQEPPPSKNTKPLPIPSEGQKKKRGGKRYRKLKEPYEITELRKMQNRMKFGEKEDEIEGYEVTKGLGMIKNSGKVRAGVVDPKTKTTLSKRYKHLLAQNTGSSSSKHSGGLTSLAFTPVQGLELQNPNTKEERKDGKYFDAKMNRYMFVEKEDK